MEDINIRPIFNPSMVKINFAASNENNPFSGIRFLSFGDINFPDCKKSACE